MANIFKNTKNEKTKINSIFWHTDKSLHKKIRVFNLGLMCVSFTFSVIKHFINSRKENVVFEHIFLGTFFVI